VFFFPSKLAPLRATGLHDSSHDVLQTQTWHRDEMTEGNIKGTTNNLPRREPRAARYMLLILSNEIKGNHRAHMKAEFLEKQTNIYMKKSLFPTWI
jgi:hypothetical protein